MMKHTGNIALVLSIAIIVFIVIDKITIKQHKIGIVQMEQLVYEYQGMKDATETYNAKMDKWSNQTDSLENILKNLYEEIQLDSIGGNKEKLLQNQHRFYLLQRSYYEFKENVAQKAQEEDQKMTIGVINQLKQHIKEYAKQEHHNIIIANTQLQNVGYVDDALDITKELLEYANIKYQGGE